MYKLEYVKRGYGRRSKAVKVLYCDVCNRKLNWVIDRDGRHICEKCYSKLATNGSSRSK